jgi:hypothetical protein
VIFFLLDSIGRYNPDWTHSLEDTWFFMFGDITTQHQLSFFAVVGFSGLLVLNGCLFYCGVLTTARLYEVLCVYQPWIALAGGAQPAHKSVTLGYRALWFPLGRALRNGHILMAWLMAWQFAPAILPLVQTSLFPLRDKVIWHGSDYQEVPGSLFTWRDELDLETSPDVFTRALASVTTKMLSNKAWPVWSSPDSMLLPIEVDGSILKWVGMLNAETEALRPKLECTEVPVQVVMRQASSTAAAPPEPVEELLVSSSISRAPNVSIPRPCSFRVVGTDEPAEAGESAFGSNQVVCMRWWFNISTNGSLSRPALRRWIITVLKGPALWKSHESPYGEVHFSSPPLALALECQTALALEPVNITISPTRKFDWGLGRWLYDNLPPLNYQYSSTSIEDGANSLPESIGAALDHGLDRANTRQLAMPLVRTQSFVGDFLSWNMYRHRYAACPPPCSLLNSSDLRATASRLFAAYVVAGMATTTKDSVPLLIRPLEDSEASKNITIHQVGRRSPQSSLSFPPFVVLAILFTVINVLTFYVAKEIEKSPWVYSKNEQEFVSMPIIASLKIIENSVLTRVLETEIPSIPADCSRVDLHKIHRAIERLGYRYRLATMEGSEEYALVGCGDGEENEIVALE